MQLKAYSAKTHHGPYFKLNEDSYDFDFTQQLYMILDGFGGSGIGDVLVTEIKNQIKNYYAHLAIDPDVTMPLYFNGRNLLEENALINALLKVHQDLYEKSSGKSLNLRGGASVLLAAQTETMLCLLGVGNCRAYHYRRGTLTRVLEENSLRYLSNDSFNSRSLHFNQVPMSAVGLYPHLDYQLKEVRISENDKFIFLTDGIYHFLSDQELAHLLHHFSGDLVINDLLKLSNSRGNKDNQAAMILEF